MRKMRICAIFSCCLALLLALAACGGSDISGKSDSTGEPDAPQGYEGTWRYVHEDAEQWLDLVENGRAFRYDVQYDRVTTGSWVETEEGVTVTWDVVVPPDMEFSASAFELQLIDDGEGGLLVYGVDPPFTRAEGLEVPRVTVWTLATHLWIDPENEYELCVYSDGSWDICDSDSETMAEGDEGGTAIDGHAITLTTLDGDKLELELSEEGTQIAGYGDMVFVRGDLLAGREDEDDEDDEAYQETSTAAFIGWWEYQDYYVWVDIREDGTYEWVDGDNVSSGSYTMEEDELVLDNGLRFSLLKIGGLLDSDGDTLIRSTGPDSDWGTTASGTVSDFVGCWEYEDYYVWVDIREDGTYEWVDGDNVGSGSYTIEGDELVLDNGLRFAPDGAGGLIDSEGDTLFPSELPDHISGPVALSAA